MADNKEFKYALPAGYVLKGGNHDYTIEETLGKGGFGITYKVKARIKAGNITVTTHFAVKEFFPSGCWREDADPTMCYAPTAKQEVEDSLNDFVREGKRLQEICKLNSNIVNVNEVFSANGTAYYVMEYLSGGDLRTTVKNNKGGLSEATMMSILNPVASALASIHNNMMLHLDIKPENIVMRRSDDGGPDVPVLIDFGIAVHFKKDGSPTTKNPSKGVSSGFSPSEQYAGVSKFEPRLDIYALAATCFYMLTGVEPKSAFEITPADISTELAGKASERTIAAIAQGMNKDASNRPSSIAQFLKLFKKSNALPVGNVVNGQYQNYMIMGVVDETPNFIHYKATTASTDDHSTHATSKLIYDLWENFIAGSDTRNANGTVQSAQGERIAMDEILKAGYRVGQYGYKASASGYIDSEYFYNGVQYLAVRQGYKPEPAWIGKFKSAMRRSLKPVLIAAGVVLGVAAVAWAVSAISDANKKKHLEASARLQQAINENNRAELMDFASQDSVRAFLPLAVIYEGEQQYEQAVEMAQKALDSGELNDESRGVAQQLIDRVTPLITPQQSAQPEQTTNDAQASEAEPVATQQAPQQTQPVQPTTASKQQELKKDEEKAEREKKAAAEKKLKQAADEAKKRQQGAEQAAKPVAPKDSKTPAQRAQEAYNNGDLGTLKSMARSGNATAKKLCNGAGITY